MVANKTCCTYQKIFTKIILNVIKKLQCGCYQQYFHLELGKISEIESRLMISEKRPGRRFICEKGNTSKHSLSLSTLMGKATGTSEDSEF